MAKFIQARSDEERGFLTVVRGLYGEAFGATSRRSLEEAASEWSELSEGERSFATAHLLYLSVEAQAATQSLLEDLRDAVEELELTLEAELADDEATPTDEHEAAPVPDPESEVTDSEPEPPAGLVEEVDDATS